MHPIRAGSPEGVETGSIMNILPRKKIHADQAGFFRRFFAFAFDFSLVFLIALALLLVYLEVKAAGTGRMGPLTHLSRNWGKEGSRVLIFKSLESRERARKDIYLEDLRGKLTFPEFQRARSLEAGEIRREFGDRLSRNVSRALLINAGEKLSVLQEIIIGYLYFIFFFRFGGRTLGKRLFRLRVIDLEGKERLTWYQSFERAHGYAASTLSGLLGFFQVLWDHEGLTMHDKIAGTTVVRLPKRIKKKPVKKRKRKTAESDNQESFIEVKMK